MSIHLHEQLVDLVDMIHAKEDFQYTQFYGISWQGKPPAFSEPISMTHVIYRPDSRQIDRRERFVQATLFFDDSSLDIGNDPNSIPDNDPMARYFLSQITDVYTRHDHQICLDAIARLRPKATRLGQAYEQRLAQAGKSSVSEA